jgi:hypothetical protein
VLFKSAKMIITARWAYKKYQKRKHEKEALASADSAKHDDLLAAAREEISTTPVSQLKAGVGVTRTHSDPPPRYSHREDSASLSVSPPLDLALGKQPEQLASWAPPSAAQITPNLPTPSPAPIPTLPAPSPPISPQQQQQQTPTEIAVHGKWIWVSEDKPAARVAEQTQRQQQQELANASAKMAELPAELSGKIDEEEQEDERAELDGDPMSATSMASGWSDFSVPGGKIYV